MKGRGAYREDAAADVDDDDDAAVVDNPIAATISHLVCSAAASMLNVMSLR